MRSLSSNIEARVPISKSIRAVPFYDGGNVFRRAKEIFNPANPATTDIDALNQRARWTHTVGLGFRIKTPVGGEFGFDYGRSAKPADLRHPPNRRPKRALQTAAGSYPLQIFAGVLVY